MKDIVKEVNVHCSCGNSFQLLASTSMEKWSINSCPKCHSAYVKTKTLKKEGKVAKFASKYGSSKWSKYMDKNA